MSRRTDRESEERAQRDPLERAKRLQAFKLATAGHVWRYNAATGLTLLEPVYDGMQPLPECDPFHNRYVA